MRWTLGAHDIIFTKKSHQMFFARGQVVPIVRGGGVYQKGMDFCVDRLNEGRWVHIFPEGKVNMDKKPMRLKWGVGRMIDECNILPVVLPMWHIGMDTILPNEPPYIPRLGNKVTVLIGKPINIKDILEKLREQNKTAMFIRKVLTDKIQEEFLTLKENAENIHRQWTTQSEDKTHQ